VIGKEKKNENEEVWKKAGLKQKDSGTPGQW
jgi:hypothetical protein